jgi:putative hydrolase of the HAD superfamily
MIARAMAPRPILLDALGTLVALEPPFERFAALAAERHGVFVAPQDARRALRVEMGHYRRNCVHAHDDASLAALRVECAALIADELALELDPAALVPTLVDSMRFAPYPEVPAALARLRAQGHPLAVASNWDVSLHDVLERTGLAPLLDAVVTSAAVGASKPDARVFAAALAALGARPDGALHVGDRLEEDVEGALRAGLDAAWLDRDGAGEGPPGVRRIASLDELP